MCKPHTNSMRKFLEDNILLCGTVKTVRDLKSKIANDKRYISNGVSEVKTLADQSNT